METLRRPRLFWIAIFLAALILIVSRRPDVVLQAQFYAEDGPVWYAQAYSMGTWHALLLPRDGYLQTLPRLAAALALPVPFAWAPLVMNLVGLGMQALPVPVILSPRLARWGAFPTRCLMAATYLALPNVAELQASVTEGHWHLALAACLLVLAEPPIALWQRIAGISLVLLSGLSGPFALPLAGISVAFWWLRRGRWHLAITSVLSLCAALQAAVLLLSQSRLKGTIGATPRLLLQMLAAQIYEGALVGRNSMHRTRDTTLLAVAFLGTAIVAYCFWKAVIEWRLFIVFCSIVFAASLANPTAGTGPSQWTVMAASWDTRYWFFPALAFVWSLAWCTTAAPFSPARWLTAAALGVMLIYLPKTWILKPADNLHFPQSARRFERAQPGESVRIPILPAGWTMNLEKK